MKETKKQQIEPAKFSPTGLESNTDKTASNLDQKERIGDSNPPKSSPSKTHTLLFAGLLIVALGVLLVPLLSPYQEPKGPPAASADVRDLVAPPTPTINPSESPWADAQLLKARRDAQEILSELLTVQKRLQAGQVEIWAADDYQQIKTLAAEGDDDYQKREFKRSLQTYRDALELALVLDASSAEVAADYRNRGIQWLADNQVRAALENFNIAIGLLPDDPAITALIAQAEVRNEILTLIDTSRRQADREDQYEAARQTLLSAQALDPNYALIAQQLDNINQRIQERDFGRQMSTGFVALSNQQYDQATAAFEIARQLKPADSAVTDALQQVQAASLNSARQIALNRALQLENQEQWQNALGIYDSLLTEDASLTAANIGKLRAQVRLQLDNQIETILADPLSLQTNPKWHQANQVLVDARGINNPGTRLRLQQVQLEQVIRRARTPVILKLQSDNQTYIEIYRVAKLGQFVEQAMNLNPGRYVIVGTRSGYQDVRLELSIDGSQTEISQAIICTQTI